jgi:RNA polymerase sigma-70 factor (ECF subfamily)
MNAITRTLAELDPQAAAPTDLNAQDEDLLQMILAQPLRPVATRKRTHVRRILVVTVAVAATVALGLTKVDIGGHQVGASPAAAAVLERAADVAIHTSDPVVGPGQYLHVTQVELKWSIVGTEKRAIKIGSDGKPVVYQERTTRQSWIPYDRHGDRVIRFGVTPLRNVSRDAKAFNAGVPTKTHLRPEAGAKTGHAYSKYDDTDWYAKLPRDPNELKRALMAIEPGRTMTFYIEDIFNQVLQSGVAPADIRAALFKALAETPGVTMLDGVTNLDDRAGVAIGYRGSNWQMLFDKQTGQFIGNRATWPEFPDVPGIDADKTTWLSTVRSEVVDSAPRPD